MSKKYIVLLFTLLSITINCFGQSGWVWQNPLPSTNTAQDIISLSNNTIFLATDNCGIFKSTDIGATWLQGSCQSFNHYNTIQFLNAMTGFAGGNYTLVKTTDGGNNWQSISTVVESFERIHFFDENTGYILNYSGSLYKTTNGGNTRTNINTGGYWMKDFYFMDQNNFICTGQNVIFKSTNGGANWIEHTESSGVYLMTVHFIDANTGLVGGSDQNNNAYILNTSNGGITWYSNTMVPAERIVKVQFVNYLTAYALSYNGYFMNSTNSGTSWRLSQFDQPNYTNVSMTFLNPSTGFIDGFRGRLFKTTNSGINWAYITHGSITSLRDIYFVNSLTGFAAGDSTTILRTTNAGNNWSESDLGYNYKINSICFISPDTGFAACDSGKLYKTINEGANWNIITINTSSNLYNVKFLNGTTGLVGGAYGFLVRTTNGGNNWQAISIGSNAFVRSICFSGSNTAYLTGDGNVYKSTNNGINWFTQFNIPYVVDYFNDISFSNSDTGSVIGMKFTYPSNYYSKVYTTFDGGTTWNITSNLNQYPYNLMLKYIDMKNAYFISNSGFYKTTNSGFSWSLKSILPSFYSVNGSFFLDSSIGYVVGDYGTILKTTDGGGNMISGIQNHNSISPVGFILSQNYPNPFNPQTKIKFDISKQSFAKIIIYDILGREVTTLVNEELKPGTYSYAWDGSNYASGIYFYQLVVGDFVETKKMVLMK